MRCACKNPLNGIAWVVQYTQLESIRLWYLQFNKPEIDSWTYLFESTGIVLQKSICERLRKYSWSGLWGWVENVVDSSWFDRIDTNRTNRLKFVATFQELGSFIGYFKDLDFRWAMQGGLKMLSIQFDSTRFDWIDTNRFPCCRFIMPEVDLRDATPCQSSRDVHVTNRIELNRKVPWTNRLSLGVLELFLKRSKNQAMTNHWTCKFKRGRVWVDSQ